MKTHLFTILFLLFLFLHSNLGVAQVLINEVELNPEQWAELANLGDDDDMDEVQWVELFNSDDDTVDISGWSIVPLSHPDREFVISEMNLSSQDFFVIFFEEKEERFDWREETLILTNREDKEVDRTPPLSDPFESDCTWGRYPDGSSQWIFQESTMYSPSSGKPCEEPDFSRHRVDFNMHKKVNGSGFVNIRNTMEGVLEEDLKSKEHGSGRYKCEENSLYSSNFIWGTQSMSLNKSDLSAKYGEMVFNVTLNRPVRYDTRWTESSMVWSALESSYISESIKYAKGIDMDQQIQSQNSYLTGKTQSEFEGIGRIESKLTDYISSEEYAGSFKVLNNLKKKDYRTIESSVSGDGFVDANKEVIGLAKTQERGTGAYNAEVLIDTRKSSLDKNIEMVHAPVSYAYDAKDALNRSVKWREQTRSGESDILFADTEYSNINMLEATTAVSTGKVKTSADFSGNARMQVAFQNITDPSSPMISMDNEYIGNYSILRQIFVMPIYNKPHISVASEGSINKPGCDMLGYKIILINDGNKTLGPVYVKDFFPFGAKFAGASLEPFALTSSYANWSIPVLGAGNSFTINLDLQITKRQESYANWVSAVTIYQQNKGLMVSDRRLWASNISALKADWSDCGSKNISAAFTAKANLTTPDILDYRLLVQNLADENMSINITVLLPQPIEFIDSTPKHWQINGERISWKNELLSGEWMNISFMWRAAREELLTSWAHIRGSSPDGREIASINVSAPMMLGKNASATRGYDLDWLPCGDSQITEMIGLNSWNRTSSSPLGCLCKA